MADITYCANDKCEKRYKCERYRDLPGAGKGDFWFSMFKPESCPERDSGNIWENEYYENIEKMEKEYKEKILSEKDWFKCDLAALKTNIFKLLNKKISDEDMEKVLNLIDEVGVDVEKRGF